MSETKHTPGPWIQCGSLIYAHDGNVCALSEPRKSRAVQYDKLELGSPDWDEAMANAKLIAAAPDLYAALVALSSNPHINLGDLVYYVREREGKGWDGPAVTAWGEAVQAAKAAIAEAEGENHD